METKRAVRCGTVLLKQVSQSHSTVVHLNSQSDGVEQDQDEHDILKPCGVNDRPELILDWILWDVELQGLGL